jgi:hypothetical protein
MNDSGLTYLFLIPVRSDIVIRDYRSILTPNLPSVPRDVINNILSYNIHPDWVCYLSMLKALSAYSAKAEDLYFGHLSRSCWSFPRRQVIQEIGSIGQTPGLNTLLYIPEEGRWQMSRSSGTLVVKMRLTEDSIETCWESRECLYYSEIHHKYSLIGYLSVALSIIEDMFGCVVRKNANGNFEITGSKNRTSDEAAQRVLLHYLKQVGQENKFHYRVGKVKFSKACYEFDIRLRELASPISLVFSGPKTGIVPDFRFKTESVKRDRISQEDLAEKIKQIREKERESLVLAEEKLIKEKERYEKGIRAYFRSQYYEVMREMMIKKDFQYKARVKEAERAKNHVLFKPRTKDVFLEVLDQYNKIGREKTLRRREMFDRRMSGEITKEEQKNDTVLRELEERQEYFDRLVDAIQGGSKTYEDMRQEMMPFGDKREIDHKIRMMMKQSLADSDDERTVATPNEEIEELESQIHQLITIVPPEPEEKRKKQEKIRELKKKLRTAPAVNIERRHKGRHLPKPYPIQDSRDRVREVAEADIKRITEIAKEQVLEKKAPTPRKENLELLGDWVDRMMKARDQKELFRRSIMHNVQVAPKSTKRPDFTEKQKKSFQYQFDHGMIKKIPTIERYSWEISKKKDLSQRLNSPTFKLSIAVKHILAESLNHLRKRSGRQVGQDAILISNSEAIGVGFLLVNKPKMLRYVIPSNLAKVLYRHYRGKLTRDLSDNDKLIYF